MRFIITGVSRRTLRREVIKEDLTYAQALSFMDHERRQRQRAWLSLRAERKDTGKVKIKIEEIKNESN